MHFLDRIRKKITVAKEIANTIGFENVSFHLCGVEEEAHKFDFIVSRAVMPLGDLLKIVRKNIKQEQKKCISKWTYLFERRRVASRNSSGQKTYDNL